MTPLACVALACCLGALAPPLAALIESPTRPWAGKALEASLSFVAFVVATWVVLEVIELVRARTTGRDHREEL